MSRPEPGPLLGLGLALGGAVGAVEVGLRSQARLGLSAGEVAAWLGAAVAMYAVFGALIAALAWGLGRRPFGALVAGLALLQAAMTWRLEAAVNALLWEPRVWGVGLALAAAAAGLGWALDGLVARRWRGLRRLAGAAGLAGAILAFSRAPGTPVTGRSGRPSVLLVTLDTARWDRFGAYGSKNATPALDRLAQQGVLFETAVSTAPLTEPSHLAILTGLPPYASGVVANGTALGDRPALLSRALQDRGWHTAAFVSAFPLHGRFGWTQGFEVYDDDFGATPGLHRLNLVGLWDQLTLPGHALRERRGDRTLGRALRWLEAHGRGDFFLWVHLFDPHAPYDAPGTAFDPPTDGAPLDLPPFWPAPYREITSTAWLEGAYDAEIRFADASLGALVDALELLGRAQDTVVVVTADHGESLTEHGYLFDHGDDLFDPSLRVPLVIRAPGVTKAGHRVPAQVSNLDVTPTLLSLLGLEAGLPGGGARLGRDLRPALAGGDLADAPVLSTTLGARYVASPPVDHALRTPGWKLLAPGLRQTEEPQMALYDLTADPGETRPLRSGTAATVAADPLAAPLAASLQAALDQGAAPVAPESDAATLEALRALGYIR